MHNISNNFPELVRVYTIGKSVQGRQLWVALVTKDPHNDDQLLKPNVKYVANMHGNEVVGRELLLQLLVYLVNSYPSNQYIKYLLENTRIHLMPSMNPDGYEMSAEGECQHGDGRGNANGFDLNRNFPDFFAANNYDPAKEQPETRAVRLWIDQIPFVLSANLHGGALVASYPFDNQQNSREHSCKTDGHTDRPELSPGGCGKIRTGKTNLTLHALNSSTGQSYQCSRPVGQPHRIRPHRTTMCSDTWLRFTHSATKRCTRAKRVLGIQRVSQMEPQTGPNGTCSRVSRTIIDVCHSIIILDGALKGETLKTTLTNTRTCHQQVECKTTTIIGQAAWR